MKARKMLSFRATYGHFFIRLNELGSADKIWFKKGRGWKVPSLMSIRGKAPRMKLVLWYIPEEFEFSRFKCKFKKYPIAIEYGTHWVLMLILDWQLKLGYTHSYYSLYQEDSHLTSLQHWYQLILIMSASVCTPTTWRLRRWTWSILYFGLVLTPTVYSGRTNNSL
jgi:hypothetical protein